MSGYKQEFLAIKYDYDTQCSMTDEMLTEYISVLDYKINPTGRLGTISGSGISGKLNAMSFPLGDCFPQYASVPQFKVYYAQDGEYTRVVITGNESGYYIGDATADNICSSLKGESEFKTTPLPRGTYTYTPPKSEESLGTLYGSYINGEIPVIGKEVRTDMTNYWALDGDYTKIVEVLNVDAYNYKKGDTLSIFYLDYRYDNPNNITSQSRNFKGAWSLYRGAYIYKPPVVKKPSDAEIAAAFDPIGKHYANLINIKERLNKFLEKASDHVADSEMQLTGEERYENRAHPENSVAPKEIAYGLFSELRTPTIPVLLALGFFMASISILMIFQMIGFTGQINVPPALIKLQAFIMTPSVVPFYQNPMVLSGVSIVLGVAVVILGIMYFRAKQG